MQIFTLKALLHIIFVFLPTMKVYLVSTQPYTWRLTPITFWSWRKGVIVSLQGPKHLSGYLLDNRQFFVNEGGKQQLDEETNQIRSEQREAVSLFSVTCLENQPPESEEATPTS